MLIERPSHLRLVLILVVVIILAAPLWTKKRFDTSTLTNTFRIPQRKGPPPPVPLEQPFTPPTSDVPVVDAVDHDDNFVPEGDYRILYSLTTKDQKYFSVDLGGDSGYNPNIIPHPSDNTSWIVVAQDSGYRDDINMSEQDWCIARFQDGVLHCSEKAEALPIMPSILGNCTGKDGIINIRRGPRDGRLGYGPDYPYFIYGSQSYVTCLGLWVQNLWMLLDGFKHPPDTFARGLTEIKRPPPRMSIEKNYFLFWDPEGNVYAHYDIYPKRSFSQLNFDGGPKAGFGKPDGFDLGELTEKMDEKCMAKFPFVNPMRVQGIHQGTNSLSITMCKRADPSCKPTDANTFIMHLMQHKNFWWGHALYEPYPVLFHRTPPFQLHAVGQKPLYYHGRNLLTNKTGSRNAKNWNLKLPTDNNDTEMVYTTSMSWKNHGQTYHGYLDDPVFLAFGLEDTRAAAIDVLAADMLQDLDFCEETV